MTLVSSSSSSSTERDNSRWKWALQVLFLFLYCHRKRRVRNLVEGKRHRTERIYIPRYRRSSYPIRESTKVQVDDNYCCYWLLYSLSPQTSSYVIRLTKKKNDLKNALQLYSSIKWLNGDRKGWEMTLAWKKEGKREKKLLCTSALHGIIPRVWLLPGR